MREQAEYMERVGAVLPGERRGWTRWWSLARQKPLGTFSVALIGCIVAVAALANVVAPYDPVEMFGAQSLQPPSGDFLLGTDHLGRDLFSRIIHGARISLAVGLSSVAFGLLIGCFFGMLSAYAGGRLDMVVQRVMDAMQTFPGVILALAILAALGPSTVNVALAIGFALIPRNNRVVRGAVLAEKNNVYVEAARAIGCRDGRVMFRHILPNVMAPVIIIAAT